MSVENPALKIRTMLRNRKLVWTLVLVVATVGLVYFAMDKRIWLDEEVALADGRVIVISRTIHAKPLGEIGGPGGWEPTYASVEVSTRLAEGIPPKWESDKGLIPLLMDFDRDKGEWYLVATFFMCDAWHGLGKPKLPYGEFRARNGVWERVELSPGLIGRKANISTGIRYSGQKSPLTILDKVDRDIDLRIAKKYLEVTAKWTTGCQ